ncbi:PKD domain-containing protein [Panacibacter ginsenosidivorans]|uniref:PKD domain-containing protein n=1 Tax=Panacibacter ginsenosidivorans TaxID=1813871 RepID=A0A5B8V6P3_9BACT|nr:PKD domain-containing protein [Panacibacter ginsenosidivorans]QEC67147.1 PKD domain-containing protein [Panacibacter ginsenosidivorans]
MMLTRIKQVGNYFNIKPAVLLLTTVFLYASAFAQPKADFTASVTSGCTPLLVNFKDASTGNPTEWLWNLGNGAISTKDSASAIYITPGTYTIKLRVKNASGEDSIVKTNYITVYAKPTINFNASPVTGCIPLNVNFTDLSTAGSGTLQNWVWDFGDGTSSIDQNPAHTYNSSGSFNVSLFIVNSFGCQQSIIKPAFIKPADSVHADFSYSYLNICKPPTLVNFTNASVSASALTYSWDFGNGGQSTATNPSQTYNTPGTYNVSLIATNSAGCSDTIMHPISIGNVSAGFSLPQGVCVNEPALMSDSSSPVAISATWDFGDGQTASGLSVTHTYTVLGSYVVTYTANFGGCNSVVTKTINVTGKPTASFTSPSVLTSCLPPLTVQFNNTSVNATTYVWDFGDGTTSALDSPQHTYTVSGNYTVKLIAISAGGCSDTITRNNYVRINQPRINGFANLPFLGCAPATVPFKALIASPEIIGTYLWDFGDGTTSTQPTPTHIYTNTGTYTVTLTVTTVSGCTVTYKQLSAVVLAAKPVANFSATPLNACASDSVKFTDLSTGNVDTWSWYFGDGNAYTNQNPLYHYTDTGYFSVTLVVESSGCSDTLKKNNYVYVAPPVAAFNIFESCDTPYEKTLQDISVAPKSWNWDFGDGIISNTQNPAHVYTTPGSYNIRLIVTNGACADTIYKVTNVIDENPTFAATPLSGNFCKFDNIQFTAGNLNMTNVNGIRWAFGDGTSNPFNINNDTILHKYDSSATYNVRMIVSYTNGCYDTALLATPITINGPKAAFANGPGTCADSIFVFTDQSSTYGGFALNKWIWDYGDGTIDTLTGSPFQHRYADSGTYNIKLKVFDANGCYDSTYNTSSVIIGKPYADFSILDSLRCTSSSVSFSNQSAGLSLQYNWNFGDGTISNATLPAHFYATEGIYTVSLSVSDIYGCKDSAIKPTSVTISNPVAAFSISDSASRCTLPVQATNMSKNYSSLAWDFGDGGNAVIDNPFHLYTVPGKYNLQLIAKGYGECYDTAYRSVELRGPYGTFQFTANDGCFPLTVTFNANTTSTVSYIWDFGDGSVKKTLANNTIYTYTTPGTFVPRVLLEDSSGCTVALESSDTAHIAGVKPKFYLSSQIGCDSSLVTFTDSSYIVNTDPLAFTLWDFGDGTTSNITKPVHYYNAPGNYLVTQTVKSVAGCVATYTLPVDILINKSPKLKLGLVDSACVNSTVAFDVKDTASLPETLQWLWDIGNGNQSSTQNFNYTYTTPGIYNVSVIATSSITGCADTVGNSLNILGLPLVNAGNDTSVCLNTFAILNPSGASSYRWAASPTLSCTNCTNPLAAPTTSTTYYVTGSDNFGCQASDSVTVIIVAPTQLSLSVNSDTLCQGSSIQLAASGAQKYLWQPPTGLSSTTIENPVASPTVNTVYTVIGSDNIGCFADTQYVSILVAPLPTFDIADTLVKLSAGSTYRIATTSSPDVITWSWNPPAGLNSPNVEQPLAETKFTTTYRGTASNAFGCSAIDNITIEVSCNNSNVYIPNTFSPNGDGNNEYFLPRGKGLFNIKSMKIFNRWGVAVFEKWNFPANSQSNDAAWDGTYLGKPQPADVYVYVIDVICENGTVLSYKGNVTLLR